MISVGHTPIWPVSLRREQNTDTHTEMTRQTQGEDGILQTQRKSTEEINTANLFTSGFQSPEQRISKCLFMPSTLWHFEAPRRLTCSELQLLLLMDTESSTHHKPFWGALKTMHIWGSQRFRCYSKTPIIPYHPVPTGPLPKVVSKTTSHISYILSCPFFLWQTKELWNIIWKDRKPIDMNYVFSEAKTCISQSKGYSVS